VERVPVELVQVQARLLLLLLLLLLQYSRKQTS
jgi:hypothetical protein